MVFASGGLAFGALGNLFAEHGKLLGRVLGAMTILLGIASILPFGPLQRDLRAGGWQQMIAELQGWIAGFGAVV